MGKRKAALIGAGAGLLLILLAVLLWIWLGRGGVYKITLAPAYQELFTEEQAKAHRMHLPEYDTDTTIGYLNPVSYTHLRTIPPEELAGQEPYIQQVRAFYGIGDRPAPLACVRTYGCQQNVSDSEHMKGLLARMGFGFTDIAEEADLILFNTCACLLYTSYYSALSIKNPILFTKFTKFNNLFMLYPRRTSVRLR